MPCMLSSESIHHVQSFEILRHSLTWFIPGSVLYGCGLHKRLAVLWLGRLLSAVITMWLQSRPTFNFSKENESKTCSVTHTYFWVTRFSEGLQQQQQRKKNWKGGKLNTKVKKWLPWRPASVAKDTLQTPPVTLWGSPELWSPQKTTCGNSGLPLHTNTRKRKHTFHFLQQTSDKTLIIHYSFMRCLK